MESPLTPARSFTVADFISPGIAPSPKSKASKPEKPTARKTAAIQLDAFAVAAAISDRTRYRIVQILSSGVALAAVHFEYILRRDRRALARHLEILRHCGLVIEEKGSSDGRVRLNRIRPELLQTQENGCYILEYGSGVLRIPESATHFERPPGWAG